ncbi:MAG: hypothetical protein PVG27_08195 [Chloroflexota bacterium]
MDPPDAQGTTFVGTYLGDAASGSGPMISSWAVERVYAGGPLPRDLVFQTPACGWTNLTPGVRYLFSTAVTDLEWTSPDAGQPSVADSLAWELLPGDAVRLAPFDTYVASDYPSDELHAITTFEDALWSVAPDAGDGSAPDAPLDPAFGCPASWFTASPEDARGTTFVGVYVGDQGLPGPNKGDVRTFWALERVYAGGPLPEVLTMRSDGCGPTTLEAGRRYLFSTADPLTPAAWNSLAWELLADDTARLAPFGRLTEDEYPSAARALASFDAALSSVAPGAGGGEVPLRAADRTPG